MVELWLKIFYLATIHKIIFTMIKRPFTQGAPLSYKYIQHALSCSNFSFILALGWIDAAEIAASIDPLNK